MTKIFFDANILVDLINKDNNLNKPITILFSKLDKAKKKFYCSPTTFAIESF